MLCRDPPPGPEAFGYGYRERIAFVELSPYALGYGYTVGPQSGWLEGCTPASWLPREAFP